MLSRFAAVSLLLLITIVPVPSPAQSPTQSKPPAMKAFKELDFGMTFVYPADFVPADPKAAAPTEYARSATLPTSESSSTPPPCVQAPLSVGTNAADNSALVVSIIDDACPGILRQAQKIGDFVHAQLLRQLQRYGTPVITTDTRTFPFDGRPAAVILGNATPAATPAAKPGEPKAAKPDSKTMPAPYTGTTYAAKVCVFAKVPPASTFGKVTHKFTADDSILCFDFTSHKSDRIMPLLYLPVTFEDVNPRSLVPAAVLR
jgi:hypothetical protein